MSRLKAVRHKDPTKVSFTEPYPAIQFCGSYNEINDIVGMVGVDELDFPPKEVAYWKTHGGFSDDILERYCDENSTFRIPGKVDGEYYPPARIEIRPSNWVVLKSDLRNRTRLDVMEDGQLRSNYDIVRC